MRISLLPTFSKIASKNSLLTMSVDATLSNTQNPVLGDRKAYRHVLQSARLNARASGIDARFAYLAA